MADVGDAVLAHRDALDPQAECPAGVDFGVNVARLEDVGVDHSASAELDPLPAVLEPYIDLRRRFGKGEEARTEADLRVRAEVRLGELHDGALEIDHRDIPV